MSSRKIPLVVMSFDRPNYLEQVLQSILPQFDESKMQAVLVNDGHWDKFGDQNVADPQIINKCLDVFRKYFPSGIVLDSKENLGIAGNFLRAEKFAFEALDADFAFFFEDDMVLGDGYIKILNEMSKWTIKSAYIATYAAYGPHEADLKEQSARSGQLTRMIWNWAFGLSRSHWRARSALMQRYYNLLDGINYRQRPTGAVLQWCRILGWGMISESIHPLAVSSQDSVKTAVSAALGASSLMTSTVHAKYIGETGTHFNAAAYASHKFADTRIYEGVPATPREPTSEEAASYALAVHEMREVKGELSDRVKDTVTTCSANKLLAAFGLENDSGVNLDDLRDATIPIEILEERYPLIRKSASSLRNELANALIPLLTSVMIPRVSTVPVQDQRSPGCFRVPIETFENERPELRARFKFVELEGAQLNRYRSTETIIRNARLALGSNSQLRLSFEGDQAHSFSIPDNAKRQSDPKTGRILVDLPT